MKLKKIELVVEDATIEQVEKYKMVLKLLIEKGALDGVRGGQAILHFDGKTNFVGIELKYWPYKVFVPKLDKS